MSLQSRRKVESSSEPHNYTLHVYKQGIQLPTMDIHCMMILSYIHLLPKNYQQYIDVKFENTYMSVVLVDNNTGKYYRGLSTIMNILRTQLYDIDASQNEDQVETPNTKQINTEFINTLIEDQLLPCLYHYWFDYDDNYSIIYDAYVGPLTLVDGLRLYFVRKSYRKESQSKLKQKTDEQVFELLQYALQLISNTLGTNDFILGTSKPTLLDSKLFAVLACIYYPDFVSRYYRDLFKHYPNIISYVHNMAGKYFTFYVNEEIFKEPSALSSQSFDAICETIRRIRVKKERQYWDTLYFLGGSAALLFGYLFATRRMQSMVKKSTPQDQ